MTQAPLGRLLSDLFSRWKWLLPVPFIVAFLVAVLTLFQSTQWVSHAVLEFPPMPSALDIVAATDQLTSGGGVLSRLAGKDDRIERYIAILKSYRIRSEVAEQVPVDGLLRVPGEKVPDALAKRTVIKSLPGQMLSIDVTLPGPSRVGMLLGNSSRPAAETAAKLDEAYIAQIREYLNTVTASHERSEREYIEPQVAALREELLRINASRAAVIGEDSAMAPKEEHPLVVEGLAKVEDARHTACAQLAAAHREAVVTLAQAESAPTTVRASLQRVRNPEIDRVQALLTDARTRLYVLRNTEAKSDKHPDVRRELESVRQLEVKLQNAIVEPLQVSNEQIMRNAAYDSLRLAYHAAVVKEASLQAQVDALYRVQEMSTSQLRHLSHREIQQLRLEAQYAEQYEIYKMLRKALEEVKIREQRAAGIFVVLDAPRVPDRRAGPSLVKNAVAGFILGLVLCAVLMELGTQLNAWAETNGKTPEDPALQTGAPE